MELTALERMAWLGLAAREREIEQAYQTQRADTDAFARLVEERLGLPTGAFGTTHALDPRTYTLQAVTPEEPHADE